MVFWGVAPLREVKGRRILCNFVVQGREFVVINDVWLEKPPIAPVSRKREAISGTDTQRIERSSGKRDLPLGGDLDVKCGGHGVRETSPYP